MSYSESLSCHSLHSWGAGTGGPGTGVAVVWRPAGRGVLGAGGGVPLQVMPPRGDGKF